MKTMFYRTEKAIKSPNSHSNFILFLKIYTVINHSAKKIYSLLPKLTHFDWYGFPPPPKTEPKRLIVSYIHYCQ